MQKSDPGFLTIHDSILYQLHVLWNPEVQYRINKNIPIILNLCRINPIPCIDNYFCNIHSNFFHTIYVEVFLEALSFSFAY